MCEYDYYNEWQSDRMVTTRKPRRCISCSRKYRPGTRMGYTVGVCEGSFFSVYTCPACGFAGAQYDHSFLHLCSDWNEGGGDKELPVSGIGVSEEWIYDYIKYSLENGETPTEIGCEFACLQRVDAEELVA